MNKTKRKIFETSMSLFAKKGYEATSIEEITSVVGVAKGTLYYHFSSKEEIFNFLVEEGMNLLKNSISIKTSKVDNVVDKLKAIILIQIKILIKYEDFITILLSQIWGKEPRNVACKNYVFDYINIIEKKLTEFITKLKDMKFQIVGTKVTNGKDIKELEKNKKICIIMGNEGNGISNEILNLCDDYIYIKMNNNCESLNVGVATSIILYEMDK